MGTQSLPKCRGLQTVSDGLANKGDFEPTFGANKQTAGLTITANEPIFYANSLQIALSTHIRCK